MFSCRETRLLISTSRQKVNASSPQGHTQPLLSCGGPPPLHRCLLPHLLSAPKSKKPEPSCSNLPDDICGLFVCLQVSGADSHLKPPDRIFLILAWVWLHLQTEECLPERCVFHMGNWDTRQRLFVVRGQNLAGWTLFLSLLFSRSQSFKVLTLLHVSSPFQLSLLFSLTLPLLLPPPTPLHCPSPPSPAQRGCGGWTCVFLIGLSDKRKKNLAASCVAEALSGGQRFFFFLHELLLLLVEPLRGWKSNRSEHLAELVSAVLVVARGRQWWIRKARRPRRLCPLSAWRSRFHPEVFKLGGRRRRRRRRRAGHHWEKMEWTPHLQQVESRGRRRESWWVFYILILTI